MRAARRALARALARARAPRQIVSGAGSAGGGRVAAAKQAQGGGRHTMSDKDGKKRAALGALGGRRLCRHGAQ
jgi:hypothetical protein